MLRRPEGVHAAHPDHKGPIGDDDEPAATDEYLDVRVGTAHLEADGSYLISLNALPVNGQLVFRPYAKDQAGPHGRETS
jgi:hypothetical protein